jgi:hypothetical protein
MSMPLLVTAHMATLCGCMLIPVASTGHPCKLLVALTFYNLKNCPSPIAPRGILEKNLCSISVLVAGISAWTLDLSFEISVHDPVILAFCKPSELAPCDYAKACHLLILE